MTNATDPCTTGRFELRQDEDTGRLYWWGGEDGWKDPTEIGEDGVLILDGQHFAIGTVLLFREPSAAPDMQVW